MYSEQQHVHTGTNACNTVMSYKILDDIPDTVLAMKPLAKQLI